MREVVISCLALAFLAGCGKSDDKKVATQVAARVGSTEITVHQINNVLARTPNIPPEAVATAKRQILNQLIDQQLARQQAVQRKLDRSPAVMQTLEASKTEILARSFVEQVAAAQPKPSEDEVRKYYAAHPELFAQRRVFQFEEIVVAPQEGLSARIKEFVPKARTMAEISAWLKSQNAQFGESKSVRAAEQIALEQIPRLQAMKDGEIGYLEQGGRLAIFRVAASQAAPVDEATATPRIQQFLFNQRLGEAMAKEMAELKEKTKIEYLGEFALASAEAKPESPLAPAEAKPGATAAGIDKGLKGLR